MEDTEPKIRQIQQDLWMTFTVEERLRKVAELFELAKEFARNRAPKHLDEDGVERFVFKELYGFERPFSKKIKK